MRPRMAYSVWASISFAVAPSGWSKRDVLSSSVTFHIWRSVCLPRRPVTRKCSDVTGRLYSSCELSDSGLRARSSQSEAIVLSSCDRANASHLSVDQRCDIKQNHRVANSSKTLSRKLVTNERKTCHKRNLNSNLMWNFIFFLFFLASCSISIGGMSFTAHFVFERLFWLEKVIVLS